MSLDEKTFEHLPKIKRKDYERQEDSVGHSNLPIHEIAEIVLDSEQKRRLVYVIG